LVLTSYPTGVTKDERGISKLNTKGNDTTRERLISLNASSPQTFTNNIKFEEVPPSLIVPKITPFFGNR